MDTARSVVTIALVGLALSACGPAAPASMDSSDVEGAGPQISPPVATAAASDGPRWTDAPGPCVVPDGSFVVSYEMHSGGSCQEAANMVTMARHGHFDLFD